MGSLQKGKKYGRRVFQGKIIAKQASRQGKESPAEKKEKKEKEMKQDKAYKIQRRRKIREKQGK